MSVLFTFEAKNPLDFPSWTFETLDIEYEPRTRSLWMYYKDEAPPFYSMQTLSDMASVRESVRALFASPIIRAFPIRYFVMASRKPGVFQLGGDLGMFASTIRKREREILRVYAHACIDVIYGLATAFDLTVVTLSVITGQALGGGLEAALAQDFVMADETAQLGVPEVAFNTFPGMGAVTLLTRRLGTASSETIITSGDIYSGKQMYDLGVVDIMAAAGEARNTALVWMGEDEERHVRRLNTAALRRHVFPISHEELIKITDVWVECSSEVSPQDIRHMERLATAQRRKFA